mmetsp:Transcript_81153/g.216839  ORF Transcript_81153/g.216839 Transcript_81153/m.216839 type:complete len:214 (-) Transcript_81153:97-738(-)
MFTGLAARIKFKNRSLPKRPASRRLGLPQKRILVTADMALKHRATSTSSSSPRRNPRWSTSTSPSIADNSPHFAARDSTVLSTSRRRSPTDDCNTPISAGKGKPRMRMISSCNCGRGSRFPEATTISDWTWRTSRRGTSLVMHSNRAQAAEGELCWSFKVTLVRFGSPVNAAMPPTGPSRVSSSKDSGSSSIAPSNDSGSSTSSAADSRGSSE